MLRVFPADTATAFHNATTFEKYLQKEEEQRLKGARFPIAPHHLCSFEGLEIVHRPLYVCWDHDTGLA